MIIVYVINKRDGDTILKVAASQFGKKIEKYVDKTAEVYIQKELKKRESEKSKISSMRLAVPI